jgi:hypothetical protein
MNNELIDIRSRLSTGENKISALIASDGYMVGQINAPLIGILSRIDLAENKISAIWVFLGMNVTGTVSISARISLIEDSIKMLYQNFSRATLTLDSDLKTDNKRVVFTNLNATNNGSILNHNGYFVGMLDKFVDNKSFFVISRNETTCRDINIDMNGNVIVEQNFTVDKNLQISGTLKLLNNVVITNQQLQYLFNIQSNIQDQLNSKANQITTYTKIEDDAMLLLKANQATTYSKVENDATTNNIQTQLNTKVTTNSNASVSSLTIGNLVLVNGLAPCFGKIIISDGSGWYFNMAKRTSAGEITDLFYFGDQGQLHTPKITLDDGNGNIIGHALISSAGFLSNNSSGWNYLTFKNGSALQGAIEMTPSKKLTHYVTNDNSVLCPILSLTLNTTEITNNLLVLGNITATTITANIIGNITSKILIGDELIINNSTSAGWNYISFKNSLEKQWAFEITPSKTFAHLFWNGINYVPLQSISFNTTTIHNDLVVSKNVVVSGSLTIGNLVIVNGLAPCFGKIIISDGTGWYFNMAKKTSEGVITDLFTFGDKGELYTPRNTLDDGYGNLTVAGNINVKNINSSNIIASGNINSANILSYGNIMSNTISVGTTTSDPFIHKWSIKTNTYVQGAYEFYTHAYLSNGLTWASTEQPWVRSYISMDGYFYRVSDFRLKENINFLNIDHSLEFINNLQSVYYNFKETATKKACIGFIAQDVKILNPYCVNESITEEKYLSISHDDIFIHNVNATKKLYTIIKEQSVKLVEQSVRITALEETTTNLLTLLSAMTLRLSALENQNNIPINLQIAVV